ncbi:LacI family DNA-binding transcriptional regulator [Bifidobacterium moukalabense]|uniref:LacI family DNA-binding transcriptional regulator n=1 Tax=Bifidobacterium moukalabense TaxID=1333651 RepID=UPI0010F61292|nr:LacI family DNA-binding transcriptional regulator [Bifidobacterium moukalabense]
MAQTTIEDVAKAAGVSTFTVSRALRGMDHVAPRTREKVLKAAKELNYTVSKAASALASGQTNRIALLSRDRIAGWFMGELLDGLYDVLNPAHYDLMIYRAGSTEERSGFFTNLPANRNADALIITGFSATEQEDKALEQLDMPIVSVNSPDDNFCQGSVAIDDQVSESMLVRYLAAIGHRKFCYIGRKEPLPGSEWGHDDRTTGYRNTIADLNLTDCGIRYIDVTEPRSVRQTVAAILALPERPTALCVWSDHYALAVMHELRCNGVRVPEDISVAGHDGSDVATSIDLTTMAQPAREIGRITAHKALDLISKKTLDEPRTIIQTILTPGGTTRPIAET